jgi:D-alanyl-D-alanine carboxypeptidase
MPDKRFVFYHRSQHKFPWLIFIFCFNPEQHMKKFILLIALTALSFASNAQVPPALDSIFTYTLDSLKLLVNAKSLSAAVELPDTSIWAGANGISAVGVNATVNDAYVIGSVTKTITAACILQLAEQNILNLDDSLHSWLDTIQYINPDITIRQLLRHQSGIYDVLTDPACQPAMFADPDSIWATGDLITTFIHQPLFAPGTSWSYSNTNYLLLSMIIDAATGNHWYEELRNRFFIPLNLNSAAAFPYEPLNTPVAHLWLDLNGDGITDDAYNWFMNTPALNASGGAAGCYFFTPTDITKWMYKYMRGDVIAPSIMSQAYVTVAAPGLPGTSYGLGLMNKYFLGFTPAYGHGGDFGYAASSWYFPTKDISITVLTNDADYNSWSLIPVVTALLKSYNNWITATHADDQESLAFRCRTFPNPFQDHLTIGINSAEKRSDIYINIIDAFGRSVDGFDAGIIDEGRNSFELNTTNWVPGIYYACFQAEKQTIKVLKIIKE